MKKMLLFLTGVCLVGVPRSTSAAIVYSGPQNVTLALDGGPAPLPEFVRIDLLGTTTSWDDFTVVIGYFSATDEYFPVTGGSGATMDLTRTHLSITGTYHMSIGVPSGFQSEVLGTSSPPVVENFALGELIGPASPIADATGEPPLPSLGVYGDTIEGQFDESGGYIGLALRSPADTDFHYGWLHLSDMSNIGYTNQRVTFDGWAYETVAGQGLYAGDTGGVPLVPAPGALVLASLGAGLLSWWHRHG